MVNGRMTNYIMPASMDVPSIRVFFEEIPYTRGPAGAKGLGELPLDGTAPAIANAIAHATGVDITRIPVTPESLLSLLETAHACGGAQDSRGERSERARSNRRSPPVWPAARGVGAARRPGRH